MSKASEWAKASHAVSMLEVSMPRDITVIGQKPISDGDEGAIRVHASVGRKNDAPTLSLTDYRLGGIVFEANAALSLARWILVTFGDSTSEAKPTHPENPVAEEPR